MHILSISIYNGVKVIIWQNVSRLLLGTILHKCDDEVSEKFSLLQALSLIIAD